MIVPCTGFLEDDYEVQYKKQYHEPTANDCLALVLEKVRLEHGQCGNVNGRGDTDEAIANLEGKH